MHSFKLVSLVSALASAVSGAPVQARQASIKRGFAYNNIAAILPFSQTGAFSWGYNWGTAAGGDLFGSEYVPMLWGTKFYDAWFGVVDAAIATGSQHVLGFNEPDLPSQASMSPQDAAAGHQQYMNPYAGKAQLGSPAVTNGAAPYGLTWLQSFFDACAGQCHVDFLAIHWYDSASNAEYFKQHVTDAINFAQKQGVQKVWVTEFQGSGDDAAQAAFLAEVLPWLDSNEGVERYAYFMVDNLVSGTQLSQVGQAYSS